MRSVPSLDRIVVIGCLLVTLIASAALLLTDGRGRALAQVTPACGNTVSGESYDACTTTADCPQGACLGGTCVEQCDGGACCSNACRFRTPDTVCRTASGSCDSAERCDGVTSTCPENAIYPSGTICRAKTDVCDSAERCDGVSTSCPSDIVVNVAICRQSANDCDVAERCNGGTKTCPPDTFQTVGIACGEPQACKSPQCDGRGHCLMVNNLEGTPCTTNTGQTGGCASGTCQKLSSLSSSLSSSISSRASSGSVSSSAVSVTSSSSSARASSSSAAPAPVLPPAAVCGNRIVDSGEQCEDGNRLGGDGCGPNCLFEPIYCCAGGVRTAVPAAVRSRYPTLSAGSLCTDFDPTYNLAINATVSPQTPCLCGNGRLDAGEQCDAGEFSLIDGQEPTCSSVDQWRLGELTCTSDCTFNIAACQLAVCGDEVLNLGEGCDEGGDTAACDGDCSVVACGDGYVNPEAGEECDDAWQNVDGVLGACRTDCRLASCGDGQRQSGEECDDANQVGGDGCNSICRREAIYCCEAGKRQAIKDAVRDVRPELSFVGANCAALDPSFDASTTVSLERDAVCPCGDGFLEMEEWCDGDLYALNGEGLALNMCAHVPWLGAGYIGTVACTADCTIDDSACRRPICGDGTVDENEECDGNNFAAGEQGLIPTDCESVFGTPQRGFILCDDDCRLDTSLCQSVTCGDSQRDNGEACDAGGFTSDCDADCTPVECGDGLINKAAGEQCDDGRRNDDYLAGACRTNCQTARCGDGILDAGEQCDDGNDTDGDGCNPGCLTERIRQCNQSFCARCDDDFLCSRDACRSIGCHPGLPDRWGNIFAAFGNPLGFESYHCEIDPQCAR